MCEKGQSREDDTEEKTRKKIPEGFSLLFVCSYNIN